MNPEKYLPSQEEIDLANNSMTEGQKGMEAQRQTDYENNEAAKRKGKTIREKITNAAKMLGAAAMMAGIGQTAEAATTPNLDTRSQESAVEKIAKEKGQDGTLYGFNAKVLESKFGDKISFIETKDGTRITTENYKGSLVFLDRKGDGNLDRVIFNNDNTESRGNKNTKSKLNSKYLTQSFAELSLMASIVAVFRIKGVGVGAPIAIARCQMGNFIKSV